MIANFKLASKAAVVSRECIIVAARMIPTTGSSNHTLLSFIASCIFAPVDLTVLSRHIRVAIFDGKNVNTNAHTLQQYNIIYNKFLLVLIDFKQYSYHTCYMESTRAKDMETTSEGTVKVTWS